MNFQNSLAESNKKKSDNNSLILVISFEEDRSDGESFWTSVPVKSSILPDTLLYRVIKSENELEYHQFLEENNITEKKGIVIFGSNSSIITRSWDSIPDPIDFAKYYQYITSDMDDYEPTNFNDDEIRKNEINDDINADSDVVITLKFNNEDIRKIFDRGSTVQSVYHWLETVTNLKFQEYIIVQTGEIFTKKMKQRLSEAKLPNDILLEPRRKVTGAITQRKERCGICFKIYDCIRSFFSFVNPFARYIEPSSIWEYKPSSDIDLQHLFCQSIGIDEQQSGRV